MGRTRILTGLWTVGCCGVVLVVAGCNLAPPVRIPQVEGVQRAVNEPRQERTRTYQRCLNEALREPDGDPARDQDELVSCMKEAGFGFLAVAADHRRAHCETAFQTAEIFPDAYCFQKLE